ncbi:MAG: response regulator [Desulfobacteraceae bacterium]|jgi:two-component system NtrC family response regulator
MGKILVVDDEIEACDVLDEFLTSKGHEVYTALDGPSALEKLKEVRPHIILLDMIMPGMGGTEVLQEIKKIDPSVAVIMVTVVTELEKAKKTFELGAYDYITKPVDLNYLENVLMVKLLDFLE